MEQDETTGLPPLSVSKMEPRKRVNFKTSVKGLVTPDVTVEMYGVSNEDIIAEAEDLLEKATEAALMLSKGD